MKTLRYKFWAMLLAGALVCGGMGSSISARQASKASSSAASGAKVDLNTASEKELVDLPGVGPATAKKIIAGRPYSSVDDLSKAGVPARTISKISSMVTVSGATPAPSAKPSAKIAVPPSQPTPAASSQPAAAPSQPPPPPSKPAQAAVSQGSPGAGMVWVNLETGVYHYQSSRYYGKTKSGKYLSEADAMRAGYHAAKNEKKTQ